MRIIYWLDHFPPSIGGVEVMAEALTTELALRGHQVAVITNRLSPDLAAVESRMGVSISRHAVQKSLVENDLQALKACLTEINEIVDVFKPDVHHLHLGGLNMAYLYGLTRGCHIGGCVVNVHGVPDNFDASQGLVKRVLAQANRIIGVSQDTSEALIAMDPDLAGRLTYIHNALTPSTLPLQPLSLEQPTIIYAGRLAREKGVDIAIRAMPKVLSVVPRARFRIFGDGQEREVLEQLVSDLRLWANVDFAGWIEYDETASYIDRSTVVVVPSRYREGFGLIALQAAQRGRPVVGARIGGIPEVVSDGETGLLFEAGAHDQLADSLIRLLTSSQLCYGLGNVAPARARRKFSFAACADAYEKLYVEILENCADA